MLFVPFIRFLRCSGEEYGLQALKTDLKASRDFLARQNKNVGATNSRRMALRSKSPFLLALLLAALSSETNAAPNKQGGAPRGGGAPTGGGAPRGVGMPSVGGGPRGSGVAPQQHSSVQRSLPPISQGHGQNPPGVGSYRPPVQQGQGHSSGGQGGRGYDGRGQSRGGRIPNEHSYQHEPFSGNHSGQVPNTGGGRRDPVGRQGRTLGGQSRMRGISEREIFQRDSFRGVFERARGGFERIYTGFRGRVGYFNDLWRRVWWPRFRFWGPRWGFWAWDYPVELVEWDPDYFYNPNIAYFYSGVSENEEFYDALNSEWYPNENEEDVPALKEPCPHRNVFAPTRAFISLNMSVSDYESPHYVIAYHRSMNQLVSDLARKLSKDLKENVNFAEKSIFINHYQFSKRQHIIIAEGGLDFDGHSGAFKAFFDLNDTRENHVFMHLIREDNSTDEETPTDEEKRELRDMNKGIRDRGGRVGPPEGWEESHLERPPGTKRSSELPEPTEK